MMKEKSWKKRMSKILLLVILVCSFPKCVEAARFTLAWPLYLGVDGSNEQGELTVEQGKKGVYIGDYVYETIRFRNLSTYSDVSYHSEKPAVASVNKKTGLLNLKHTGKAVITIQYKKKVTTCELRVVKKGSIKTAKKIPASLKVKAEELEKVYGKKVTATNCYEVNQAIVNLEQVLPKNKKVINGKGFACKSGHATKQLILPSLGRLTTIQQGMEQYIEQKNPIGINPTAVFEIKSVSGSKKNVSIQLKKQVTQEQIFAIQQSVSNKRETEKQEQISFEMELQDLSNKKIYLANASVKKGSALVTVSLTKSLKKNHTYRLLGKETEEKKMPYGWTRGKKISIK